MNKVSIFRTAKDRNEFLVELPGEPMVASTSDISYIDLSILIDPTVTYQELEGFGGAFTESAAVTWLTLPEEKQNAVINSFFDSENGNNYRFCRTHINSCDFSEGNYACCDVPGDTELKSFNIEREKKAIIPMIKAAQKVAGADKLKLFASPWSPPGWMKDSGKMNRGGKLLPQYRQAWADYYCHFIQEFAAEGIKIGGLTVQNEPEACQTWDSCLYSGEEERDFVRDYLGPTLEKQLLGDVKLMIYDHNRDRLFERAKIVYDDPKCAKYVWGAAFHWYCGDQFDNVLLTHEMWPDKKLVFSEGCQEGGPHLGEWELGERYARNIINDLNRYTVAWVDWNILLNEQGGPNHVGNYCSAPLLVDRSSGELKYQSSYYYIGHFSRFIQPQARRILCASSKDLLESTAFMNPDGSIVVVILNRSEIETPVWVKINGEGVKFDTMPRSIVTIKIEA